MITNDEAIKYLLLIDAEGDHYQEPCKDMNAVEKAIIEYVAGEDVDDLKLYMDYIADADNWSDDKCHWGFFEIGSWTLLKVTCDLYIHPSSAKLGELPCDQENEWQWLYRDMDGLLYTIPHCKDEAAARSYVSSTYYERIESSKRPRE